MSKYDRELSNLSYTNKDFGRIYPELLDLAKKISYRWDPSKSDESDPGVVLLKLAALIGDKNNYNIDKNILELFPASVTQDRNARQIFDQCGYSMRHYISSLADLHLMMREEPDLSSSSSKAALGIDETNEHQLHLDQYERCYVIPQFTMFSNEDNSLIFTTTKSCTLRSTGVEVTVPIIQGTVVDFNVNGDTLITPQYLDYNNRLYFAENDIAENGIFILDTKNAVTEWQKVNNLLIQPLGSRCYKFGVSLDGSRCYIEFPSDIDTLIGEGINIKYIRTLGSDGNVNSGVLSQLYVDTSVSRYLKYTPTRIENDVTLTSKNLYITNSFSVVRGQDPETISEARISYEKIKNTFETLVSTRDYSNYFYTNNYMSNGFVCDRSDDIQSSYTVSEVHDDSVTQRTRCNEAEISPFDLRVYGLTYVPNIEDAYSFSKSFTVITDYDSIDLWNNSSDISNEIKLVSHNYLPFIASRMIMLKNKFPIIARIIPKQRLTESEKRDLSNNVINSLYPVINSRMIEFGEPANYELIYDTILQSDSRIQALSLEDFSYETYAVYEDESGSIQEVRIDNGTSGYVLTTDTKVDSSKTYYIKLEDETFQEFSGNIFLDNVKYYEKTIAIDFKKDIYVKSIVAGKTPLCKSDNEFMYALYQGNTETCDEVTHLTSESFIELYPDKLVNDSNSAVTYTSRILNTNENVVFYAPSYEAIKVDGKTAEFSSYVKIIHNIKQPKTGRPNYNFVGADSTLSGDARVAINKDEIYYLDPDEYIMFFWKEADGNNEPYHFIRVCGDPLNSYAGATAVKSSAELLIQTNPNNMLLPALPDDIFMDLPVRGLSTENNRSITGTIIDGSKDDSGNYKTYDMTILLHDYVSSLQGSNFVLTGTSTVTPMKQAIVNYPEPTTSSTVYVSWIVNNEKNELFHDFSDEDDTYNNRSGSYVLKSGEYFMKADAGFSTFTQWGAGTIISYTNQDFPPLTTVAKMDVETLQSDPTAFLDTSLRSTYWIKLSYTDPENYKHITITSTEYHQLGKGNAIKLTRSPEKSKTSVEELPKVITIGNSRLIPDSQGNYIETGIFKNSAESLLNKTLNNSQSEEIYPLTLNDFDVSYVDSGNQLHKLPPRKSSGIYWNAYSILNIDSSSNNPQFVGPEQYIKLYSVKDDISNEVGRISPNSYFLSSPAINKTGGYNVEVKYIDIMKDELQPVKFYSYTIDEMFYEKQWEYSGSEARLVINSLNESTYEVPLRVPGGWYMLQIDNSTNFSKLEFSLSAKDNSTISIVDFDKGNNFLDETKNFVASVLGDPINIGLHYLLVHLVDNSDELDVKLNIKVKVNDDTNDWNSLPVVTFKRLYKFTLPQPIRTWEDTIVTVTKMVEGTRFDPTHTIANSDLIEDPLDPKSFFNLNHVFNRCVISQWDLSTKSKNNVTVLDKVK